MITFHSSSATHKGMIRELNEDALSCRDDLGLWAVADGMGGHRAGDEASRAVVAELEKIEVCDNLADLLSATRSALEGANAHVMEMASRFESARVPGSTVAVLVIKQHEAAVIWVGDSRIYRFRDGTAEQLTRDHSHVQKLVDQKLITREEAESHPRANVITRAVGIEEPLKADILNFSVETGDRFLVCTDGLSRPLSIDEISTLMQAGQMDECVQSLLHEALARGARDNVTLITVECADS